MRQSNPYLFARNAGNTRHRLQLLVNVVGGGDLQDVLSSLLGGVGDLAVVDDDGVAVSAALLVGPADALGELGLGVGEEQLEKEGMLVRSGTKWEDFN
jgi:hypothetical protein